MRPKPITPDQEVARVAARQHGVVALRQLLAAGLSRAAVKRRVAKGLLHRELRAVYRVGHRAPSTEASYLAAVLACGDGAVLCGAAAAFLFRLIGGPPPRPEVLTIGRRRVRGVVTHCAARLDPRDVTTHLSIPTTTVARTLVDLPDAVSPDSLAQICHEAQVRHGVSGGAIEAALGRRRSATAARRLRPIFSGDAPTTLSGLERDFLAALESARLPLPQTNVRLDAGYVDCRWPERRLTVELDSYRYHHTRHAWERDHRRDRQARARGDEFRRYTSADLASGRAQMLVELGTLLADPDPD